MPYSMTMLLSEFVERGNVLPDWKSVICSTVDR